MCLQPFSDFLKDKTHMLSEKVVVNSKIFKYWIERKNYFFDVSPKYSFLEPHLIQKQTKK